VKVLLVAERFNLGPDVRWPAAERMLLEDPVAWLRSSRDFGAFGTPGTMNGDWWKRRGRESPQGEKLRSIGARWDDALNLLPPARSGAWEPDWARWAAAALLGAMGTEEWRYDRLLLVGARVSAAFDCPLDFLELSSEAPLYAGWENVLCLPHPSGRSRWWNTADLPAAAGIVGGWLSDQGNTVHEET
jgi:hypothetical protein